MIKAGNDRLFFLHIPKTAGSSMRAFLSRQYPVDEIVPAWTLTTLLGLDSGEVTRRKLLEGHFFGRFPHYLGRPRFTVTILRDPVERALSHYAHIVRDREHYLHSRATELGSLEAFVDADDTRPTLANFQAKMLALDVDVELIFQELNDEQREAWILERQLETADSGLDDAALLARARARLETMDLVGVTERIADVVAVLCFGFGWSYPARLEALNVNESRLRRCGVDAVTLQRLTELNSVDRALYEAAQVRFEATFRAMLSELLDGVGPIRKLSRLFR